MRYCKLSFQMCDPNLLNFTTYSHLSNLTATVQLGKFEHVPGAGER
jgi:hypothetical protein